MIEILPITGTIFLMIAVGYASVRLGLFSQGEMRSLGKFAVNFALPALILRAVSTQPLSEIVDIGYLGAVLLGSLAVFWAGYLWSRRIEAAPPSASTFSAMGMSCANSGFVGFPILLMAMPDIATRALALNMIVESLVMIPLVLVMAERSRGGKHVGWPLACQIAVRVIRNPIIIALFFGLGISASGVTVPTVLERPVDMFAAASAAVSLVVIGGTLAGVPIRQLGLPVFSVSFGKLILHPVAVAASFGAMSALGFAVQDETLIAAAVILAATPVMAIYPILAQTYGEERTASLSLLVMTALSFLTVSMVLAVMLD